MRDAVLWQPHLRDGEHLLWTGRPRGRFFTGEFDRDATIVFVGIFTVLFMPVAVVEFQNGTPNPLTLLMGFAPMVIVATLVLLDRRMRKARRYAMTNRRILSMSAPEPESVTWVEHHRATEAYGHLHQLWIGEKAAVPPVFTPGSFRHRFFTSTEVSQALGGEVSSLTLTDLDDGFALLRLVRQSALRKQGTDAPPCPKS